MTQKHRIVFEADGDLVALLEAEQVRTGASVSEICRRALRWTLAARRVAKPLSIEEQHVVDGAYLEAEAAQK